MTTLIMFLAATFLFWWGIIGPWILKRRRALVALSEEMAVSSKLNLTLTKVLEAFSCDTRGALAHVAERIASRLQEGEPLSRAMKEAPQLFPAPVTSLVEAGEKAGDVEGAMKAASRWAWRDSRWRGNLALALWYPFLISAFYVGIAGFLGEFIVPNWVMIFAGYNNPVTTIPPLRTYLPELVMETRILFGYVPLAIAVLVIVWRIVEGRTTFGRNLARIRLWIPILARLERLSSMERICRVLGMAMRSSVPLPRALRIAASGGLNPVFERAAKDAASAVEEGKRLPEALAGSYGFPKDFLWRVGLAERSKDPGGAFDAVADLIDARRHRLAGNLLWASVGCSVLLVGLHVGAWEWLQFDVINRVRDSVPL